MSNVKIAVHTDIGIKKNVNQDSYTTMIAETEVGTIVFALICDGMGGLSKGELASAAVVKVFTDWVEKELSSQLNEIEAIKLRWNELIQNVNVKISDYGKRNQIQLGSTCTALLIVENRFYLIGHVGDSRVYLINDGIQVLTSDHTLVAKEVKSGKLTLEQAENDPRRNVLLQCIGASSVVQPEFIQGIPEKNDLFMLCSDGFRHEITSEEILHAFTFERFVSEEEIQKKAIELVELNKSRNETDNITVLLIKL